MENLIWKGKTHWINRVVSFPTPVLMVDWILNKRILIFFFFFCIAKLLWCLWKNGDQHCVLELTERPLRMHLHYRMFRQDQAFYFNLWRLLHSCHFYQHRHQCLYNFNLVCLANEFILLKTNFTKTVVILHSFWIFHRILLFLLYTKLLGKSENL